MKIDPPYSRQQASSLDEVDIMIADQDISHLFPYFSLPEARLLKQRSDPDSFFSKLGLSKQEVERLYTEETDFDPQL